MTLLTMTFFTVAGVETLVYIYRKNMYLRCAMKLLLMLSRDSIFLRTLLKQPVWFDSKCLKETLK